VKTVGERISDWRRARNLTQGQLSAKLGVSQPTVSKWEQGRDVPGGENLQNLATVLGTTATEIMGFGGMGATPDRRVRVVGELCAGAFEESVEWAYEDQYEVAVVTPEDLADVPLQGFVVKGDSINKIYPDGSIVYVASVHSIDGGPVSGDIVMVMRRDSDGRVEGTLKEYVVEGGQKWLWPRSTHPEHQAPIDYKKGRKGRVEEVMITGVVKAALTFKRPAV
jgi:transcriptional regulator with XRE-family HTH domain